MGRLIDANNLNFEGQNYNKSQMKAILDFIDNQPTAYDVEKVAEDLQKASMIIEQNENSIKCAIEENMAVYIVKRGGVE